MSAYPDSVNSVSVSVLLIEDLHKRYVEKGNPFNVWQAYQAHRRACELVESSPLPDGTSRTALAEAFAEHPYRERVLDYLFASAGLPDWITSYLDSSAKDLLDGMSPAHALRLTKPGGIPLLTQFEGEGRDFRIFSYVDFHMEEDAAEPDKLYRICDQLAARSGEPDSPTGGAQLDAKTIRDIYFRLKRLNLNIR